MIMYIDSAPTVLIKSWQPIKEWAQTNSKCQNMTYIWKLHINVAQKN